MDINNLTALRIKEARIAKNRSAESVAKELDLSKAAFSQLENGHTEITIAKVAAIAQVLNVNASELTPFASSQSNTVTGNQNNIIGGEHNTVHNYYISPEEKLQQIADNLNAVIKEMKPKK
jgi:transcriptional regulator with XRE-family HTH domain